MPRSSRSHYERLNVAEEASVDVIRTAWIETLAAQKLRARHESPIAQAVALADIQAAYEVLSDPLRRARYDKRLALRRNGTAPYGLPLHSANDDEGDCVPSPAIATLARYAALDSQTERDEIISSLPGQEDSIFAAPRRRPRPQGAARQLIVMRRALRTLRASMIEAAARAGMRGTAASVATAVLLTAGVGWWAGRSMDEAVAAEATTVHTAGGTVPVLPPGAREAHADWLSAAARRERHPLDGEPLQLRR